MSTVGDADQRMRQLLALMVRLRDPEQGCAWDRAQDFASIAPFTIEEAYEVADAIAGEDQMKLRDELGDLLFQVVFHARMAEERGWFDFAQVAQAIHDKLVRRHPHVFADGTARDLADLQQKWDQQKKEERAADGQHGTLAGVPVGLPALTRAAKLGRRAAAVGFDWPDATGVRAKIDEELAEADAAIVAGDRAATIEELGDLLFSVVNWSRHLQVDAEGALRAASRKFESRFARMEQMAAQRGQVLQQLSAAQWEALWQAAKG